MRKEETPPVHQPESTNESKQEGFVFADKNKTLLLKYIGNSEYVIIPDGVKTICDGAFSGNKKIKSVTLAPGVAQIGNFSFSNCVNLSSVDLKFGLISIGDKAFEGCRSMTILLIPKSIEKIGAGAFEKCPRLIAAFTNDRS